MNRSVFYVFLFIILPPTITAKSKSLHGQDQLTQTHGKIIKNRLLKTKHIGHSPAELKSKSNSNYERSKRTDYTQAHSGFNQVLDDHEPTVKPPLTPSNVKSLRVPSNNNAIKPILTRATDLKKLTHKPLHAPRSDVNYHKGQKPTVELLRAFKSGQKSTVVLPLHASANDSKPAVNLLDAAANDNDITVSALYAPTTKEPTNHETFPEATLSANRESSGNLEQATGDQIVHETKKKLIYTITTSQDKLPKWLSTRCTEGVKELAKNMSGESDPTVGADAANVTENVKMTLSDITQPPETNEITQTTFKLKEETREPYHAPESMDSAERYSDDQ